MTAPIENMGLLEQELKGLLPMLPEYQQRLDNKIRLEFNYNSNHIEGNSLTYGETELLLIFGKTTGNHDIREYDEMKAHDAAFELIKEWAADNERLMTEMALKNLHKILLVESFWKEASTPVGQPTSRLIKVGDYKEHSNSVRLQNGEMFHYASPAETPMQMGELIQWYRDEEDKKELHPLILAALLHYKFVRIHPFDDGNGRISRLLMNYILLKHNLPPVIVKSADKRNYLFALNQADTGNIEAFINYIGEQLIWSLELYIKAAKGETLEEDDDLQKEISIWKKGTIIKKPGTFLRNDGIIYELYNVSLKTMLESFARQHEQFFDMFHGGDFNYSTKDGDNTYLQEIKNKLAKPIYKKSSVFVRGNSNFTDNQDISTEYYSKDTLRNMYVVVNLYEYKHNERNPFSVNSNLMIHFNPYKYLVQYNTKPITERTYDNYLTSEEAKHIVSDCIKDVFNQIRSEAAK